MQPHLVHQLIHDKRGTSHVARVLHQRDEEVEDKDLWQEHDDGAHTGDGAVDDHRAQRAVGHQRRQLLRQPVDAPLYPVHGVLSQRERRLEHHEKNQKEDGKTYETI